jgi:hypothetical protein
MAAPSQELCTGAFSTQFSAIWHTQIALRFQQNLQPWDWDPDKTQISKVLNLSQKCKPATRSSAVPARKPWLCLTNVSKIVCACHTYWWLIGPNLNIASNFIFLFITNPHRTNRNKSRYIKLVILTKLMLVNLFFLGYLEKILKWSKMSFHRGIDLIVRVKLREPNLDNNQYIF